MKTYSRKVLVRVNGWRCRHCNAAIPKGSFRYVYGKWVVCKDCSDNIDSLITKIAEW